MIRIGILGAARIAPQAIIHPASVRGDVVIQAIAARSLSRAETFAEKYSERNFTVEALGSYQDLLEHPKVNLIYNPLPINLHAEWTIKALEAGKHVLCEKPFAMNSGEADAVIAAAQASKRRVIEAFHYRYHPAFRHMLRWIRTGHIGAVTSIKAVFNATIPDEETEIRRLPETGGGAFMDLGCYPLSWALEIMGEAPAGVEAEAVLTSRGVDESLTAKLTFGGGVVAELSSAMNKDFSATLHIEGETGSIEFINPLAPHWGANLTLIKGDERVNATIDRTTTYKHQLDALVDGLETGTLLPTEGEAILRQQRVLDAIYEAAGLRDLRCR